MNIWPTQAQCDAFYGNPRGSNGQASVIWKAMNLTTVRPPFIMRYAGKAVQSVTIHKKCAASLSRVLLAIWEASGKSQAVIDRWGVSIFGGSFNFRLMRGSNHLSMHSYGCAIDLAPNWFPMGRHDHTFVPQVIKAFADEGWENLPNDRMHFQAARVAGLPAPQAAPVKPAAVIPASKPQTQGKIAMNGSKTYLLTATGLGGVITSYLGGGMPMQQAAVYGLSLLIVAALRHGLSTSVAKIVASLATSAAKATNDVADDDIAAIVDAAVAKALAAQPAQALPATN